MQHREYSEPRRRVHQNQDSQSRNRTNNPNQNKPKFILDKNLALRMKIHEQIYEHTVGLRNIYFPYDTLLEPQRNFLQAMFNCLDNGENLLIESPTGTGKTLNLLVGALSWAEDFYRNQEGISIFDNQTKIIYTSRAHSQLSQISKELQKTPYRPKMLLFGSREKLCINEQVERQISNGQKGYESWAQKCSAAVRIQQRYLENQHRYDQQVSRNKQTVQNLSSKINKTTQQKEELKQAQQFLKDIELRCTHYHQYAEGIDGNFWKQVDRTVLNNEKLKEMARNFTPHSICPYYYPKRVKNRGTLYLMPYNYILDSNILQYSAGFLQKSIIIFDEGHNAPQTACDGFSITLTESMFQSTRKNINDKLKPEDFEADQLQVQEFIRLAIAQPQQTQEGQEMDQMLKQIRKKNKQKQRIAEQKRQSKAQRLKNHVDFMDPILANVQKNFKSFFEYERIQDFKNSESTFSLREGNNSSSQRRIYYWHPVRFTHTDEKQKIQSWIQEIFFLEKQNEFDYKPLKEKLTLMIESLKFILNFFISKGKKFFKMMNFATFCERLYNVLYDPVYINKFFLEITQLRKYQPRLRYNIFKGQIQIRCLAPQFAFKLLQSMNPRSIIITSGTLSPMNVFGSQTGLTKLKKQQVDPVITEKNILVRKITKNLNGNPLKIDSAFYCGRNGLQMQNLTNLFNLLIKTLENIPHGVLVIVSSFSCMQYLKRFYELQESAQIRQQLKQVKPHIYFQPKKNLEETMNRFKANSVKEKGALLFCVCRAKLSEGIDFKNRLCRSVIFLGIPYVNRGDSFVVSKGRYLKNMEYAYHSEWKFIQASKAINQGLGRTVRHSKDFGSILLFDDRYENTNRDSVPVVANISDWIKQNWKVSDNPNKLQEQLSQFYSKCQIQFPYNPQNQMQNSSENLRTTYAQNL